MTVFIAVPYAHRVHQLIAQALEDGLEWNIDGHRLSIADGTFASALWADTGIPCSRGPAYHLDALSHRTDDIADISEATAVSSASGRLIGVEKSLCGTLPLIGGPLTGCRGTSPPHPFQPSI